jgi:hypothetical protein
MLDSKTEVRLALLDKSNVRVTTFAWRIEIFDSICLDIPMKYFDVATQSLNITVKRFNITRKHFNISFKRVDTMRVINQISI